MWVITEAGERGEIPENSLWSMALEGKAAEKMKNSPLTETRF